MEDDVTKYFGNIGIGTKLPKDGVYTHDGFLFHHVSAAASLKSEHIERLYECGINYLQAKRFTPEEDDILRRNWKDFAEEHDIPYKEALCYTGAGSKNIEDLNTIRDMRKFLLESNFWPRMCKDLVHRSAFQVKRRMVIIFDKAVVEGNAVITSNRRNPLSYTELMNFVEALQKYKDFRKASEIINKPVMVCTNSYRRYLDDRGEINRGEWICLWKTVLSFMEEKEPNFEEKLRTSIIKKDNNAIETLSKMIDFKQIEPILTRNTKFIKDAWIKLIEKLTFLYTKVYLRTQEKSSAWDEAISVISSKRNMIPADKFSIFLRILIRCTSDESGYEYFTKKYFNIDELQSRMLRSGITGFSLEGSYETEIVYLLNKVRLILSRCEFYIFSKLMCKFKLKERIQMICMAFDRQIEKARMDASDNNQSGDSNQNNDDITKTCIRLQRTPIIEAVILFATNLDPDWIPPTTFQKYVADENVLKLFSTEKNNSALLSRKLLRDYQDSHPRTIHENED